MKMRLAMVTPFPETPNVIRGGVEGVAYSLMLGLRAISDIELHVVAPCSNRSSGVEVREDMTLHWLNSSSLPGFVAYWSTFRRAIQTCLKAISPDVTHFQALGGWTLGYDAPYVFTIHGIAERDILFQGGALMRLRKNTIACIERRGRKRSPHTILISPYVAQEIGDQIEGKQWNIENPVTEDFFVVQRACKEPRVLYVGRLNERKNVLGLLKVFARLSKYQPSARLYLAGEADDASYKARCMEFIQNSDMKGQVRFLGNIDRSTLLKELSCATCVILISRQETAPMIIMEAMAAGIPVIASNLCGLPYMIEDGRTGYLVDPSDEEQIIDRLLRLLSNPLLATEFGWRAREVASRRFHVGVIAQRTMEVYQEAASQRRRGGNVQLS